MSRLCSNRNAMPMRMPVALRTSWLIAPFLHLAEISHSQLERLLNNSLLVHSSRQIIGFLMQPVRQRLQGAFWFHQTLQVLHWCSLLSIFLLSAFASTEVIGAATVASFGLLGIRMLTRPISWRFTVADGLVMLFFMTALVSTTFSSYSGSSLAGLAKFLVFLAGYWNFRIAIEEREQSLLWMLGLLVLLGVGESLIGLHQYANHIQPLATWQDTAVNPENQLTRIFGTLKPSNPNLLAGFLIPCLAAGAGLGLSSLAGTRRWVAGLLLPATLLILIALVLTGSRGSYLAIIAMTAMLFLSLGHLLWHEPCLRGKHILKALWLLVLSGSLALCTAAVALIAPVRTRFLSIFAMREDSSNSYRMNVWMSSLEMLRDNWLIGIGPGNETFKQVYGLYMISGYNALSAYSIFLEIWIEQGIFGLLLFLLLLMTLLLRGVLSFYAAIALERKITIGFLLAGITGSVIYGLFDTIWYRPSVNLLFWLLVAGTAVATERALEEANPDA